MTSATPTTTPTTTPEGTMTTTTRKPQKRAGGERRGNSYDRARRRRNLLIHWGDGDTCACVYCGRTLRDYGSDSFANGTGPVDHVTADKIVPHLDGPGYRMTNVIPACYPCNGRRGDRDLADMVGTDAAAAIAAHAAAYRPRRGRK